MSSKITYRQQYTRCGKERCRKCKEGAGHGPYWYAYWSECGRTLSKYIGIHLPAHIETEHQGAEDVKGHNEARQETQSLSATHTLAATNSDTQPTTEQMPEVPLQLNTQMLRIYDSEPLPETRELYEKIRQGHIGKASQPKIIIASVDEQKNTPTVEGTMFEPVSAGEAIQAAQTKTAVGDVLE